MRIHWRTNIGIGLVIEVCLILLRHDPILDGARNAASDMAMRVQSATSLGAQHGQLTFIDVDERTWRSPAWGGGSPYFAPRAQLRDLIRRVANKGPRILILDISVENPSVDGDEAFLDGLGGLPKDIDYLFIRSVRAPLYEMDTADAGALTPELQSSRLDEFIQGHPNFHIVAPYYQLSRDGLVRGWRLWTTACKPGPDQASVGVFRIVPSVQLAASILDSKADKSLLLGAALHPHGRCVTDFAGSSLSDDRKAAKTKGRDVDEDFARVLAREHGLKGFSGVVGEEADDPESRILFRFGEQKYQASINTISAGTILNEDVASPAAREALGQATAIIKGGVVLIGQSFAAAGDIHPTPLGAMPGGMIILNAVRSAEAPGVIREPGWGVEGIVLVLSVVGVGFVFALADSVKANAMAVAATVLLIVPVSMVLLNFGIWLDFAVPLIGIAVHRAIAELEDYVTELRKTRHVTHHIPPPPAAAPQGKH